MVCAIPRDNLYFELQTSQWSNKYYMNLGIFLIDAQSKGLWLPEYKADIRIRLKGLVPSAIEKKGKAAFDLECPLMEEDRLDEIEKLVREYRLPLLCRAAILNGLRGLHQEGGLRGAMVSRLAHEVLGQSAAG